ncbi:hypothetical protein EVAR_23637_1 [Eumeta japonica]|uniref:Uncharacterized protein n=1 Tax=Eumeta variegata TaxID=151549 RepID=A0A4C1VIE6_EUMVA|nr:hypothetical protein EVAR_23637_1 [Eumeta japonica]
MAHPLRGRSLTFFEIGDASEEVSARAKSYPNIQAGLSYGDISDSHFIWISHGESSDAAPSPARTRRAARRPGPTLVTIFVPECDRSVIGGHRLSSQDYNRATAEAYPSTTFLFWMWRPRRGVLRMSPPGPGPANYLCRRFSDDICTCAPAPPSAPLESIGRQSSRGPVITGLLEIPTLRILDSHCDRQSILSIRLKIFLDKRL